MQDPVRPRRFLGLRPRGWLGVLALLALGLAAAAAAAPSGLLAHARHGHGFFRHGGSDHGFFRHGAHGHGGHALGEEHIARGVRHLLEEADASDAQTEAVTAIVTAAAADLRALHDAQTGHREAFGAALLAADRAALEVQRAEALAALEGASERVVAALADAAEVLTPEQRQRLAEAHAAHHAQD